MHSFIHLFYSFALEQVLRDMMKKQIICLSLFTRHFDTIHGNNCFTLCSIIHTKLDDVIRDSIINSNVKCKHRDWILNMKLNSFANTCLWPIFLCINIYMENTMRFFHVHLTLSSKIECFAWLLFWFWHSIK